MKKGVMVFLTVMGMLFLSGPVQAGSGAETLISYDDGQMDMCVSPWATSPGSELALMFTADSYPVKLKKVHFFLPGCFFPSTPFKIFIYAENPFTGLPGIKLYDDEISVSPSTWGDWLEIDVALNDIVISQDFFVSMYWVTAPGANGTNAQTLGLDTDGTFAEKAAWKYGAGSYWNKSDVGTPMIRATVVPEAEPPDSECSFSLSSTAQNFSDNGGTEVVSVSCPQFDCNWTVAGLLPWISVSPDSGTGDGAVTITVEQNTGNNNRTGTITIAGKDYTMTQEGYSPSFSQISILSPVDDKILSFGASGGSVPFMFTKVPGAAKYVLHLKLDDILNQSEIPIPLDLVPPVSAQGLWAGNTGGTPGFSESALGMVFALQLDAMTWDVMAVYDVYWGVEAYDGSGSLIGATLVSGDPEKYVNRLKLIAANAIAMSSPVPGAALSKSGTPPVFTWETYPGTSVYSMILAHVGALGFDKVIQEDNLTLNLLSMDDTTWQGMPSGTWYWTVLGYDAMGGMNPQDFTIFDFTVDVSGMTPAPGSNPGPSPSVSCGAYVAPGVWKKFDCFNLAAIGKTTSDDPFTPSWRLIGGYWQWGRKGPSASQWYNTNTEHFAHGPIGPDSGDANTGSISGWYGSNPSSGAWSDAFKTANDPCPSGYRVPSTSQWEGVWKNNTQSNVGTWSEYATNYSSASFFGSDLMLPAAGYRIYNSGALFHRGEYGRYWSSSEKSGGSNAWSLSFASGGAGTGNGSFRQHGYSVRCVSTDPSTTSPVTLSKTQVTLESGESETISISGGTGYYTNAYSSNSNVADVSLGNNAVTVFGLSSGTATVTVQDSGGSTADISVDVMDVTCTFSITPSSKDFEPGGGNQSVSVFASDSSCQWSVSENLSWVSVTPTSGTGDQTVFISVDPASSTDSRSGTITIAGHPYTVSQDGEVLPLAADQTDVSMNAGDIVSVSISGGTGYYTVTSSASQVAVVSLVGDTLEITGLTGGISKVTVEDTGGTLVSVFVAVTSSTPLSDSCGAFVAPGVWKQFDCYNLAAIGKLTRDDPFTPSWRLNGGYWQWGRKGPDPARWYSTNTANFVHGPTGPGSSEANSGAISGWDSSYASNGAWSDTSKAANDPCPAGFRVPTKAQWDGVRYNNTQSTVGTWSSSCYDHTNYSVARFFGSDLMLPAAGYRYNGSGALYCRGDDGHYWSSSEYGSYYAWSLASFSGNVYTTNYYFRQDGLSVRCISE